MYLWVLIGLGFLFLMMRKDNSRNIKVLMKNCAKWATTAQQDESPYLSVLHANYAAGYLAAINDVANPKEVHRCTGVDVKKFQEHIHNVQDMVTKKLIKKVPEFEGEVDLYLSSIANI